MLNILTNEHPLLRQKTNPVKDPTAPELKRLIKEMIETMRAAKGIGLAANQVGENLRLFIIETKDQAISFINPLITYFSEETELSEEGCLSVPDEFGFVERSKEVTLEYLDTANNEQILEAEGLLARVIQHEFDHINGILIIDKMESISHDDTNNTTAL